MLYVLSVLAVASADRPCAGFAEVAKASARYAAADDSLSRGAEGEGVRLLNEAVRDAPGFALGYWRLGKAEDVRGNAGGAYVAYKRYLSIPCPAAARETIVARLVVLENRTPWLSDYAAAERAYDGGDNNAALASLAKTLEQKPGFALTHRLLSLVAFRLDRLDEARRSLENFARLDPTAPELVDLRATVLGK